MSETRADVDRTFATVYGRSGPAAFSAFMQMAGQDGIDAASSRLVRHPETFGAVAAGQQGLAARLGAALPVAAQIGSIPPGRAAGLEQTRDPSALRQALDFLYGLNESPGGSLAMAVGSFVPGLDHVLDVVDVGLNLDRVSQPAHRNDPQAWTNLGVTAVGAALPFAGNTVEAALKAALGLGGRQHPGACPQRPRAALARRRRDPRGADEPRRRPPPLGRARCERGPRRPRYARPVVDPRPGHPDAWRRNATLLEAASQLSPRLALTRPHMEPSLLDESYEAFKDRVNRMPTPDLADLAFDMTQDRIQRAPGLDIYVAMENEVDFVRGFLDVGAEPTDEDRESIAMGVIAVRNFEEVDPRYTKVLVALAYRFRHQGEPG